MNNNREKNIKYILWTGGWDSTYRIVELSRKKVSIQAIYIIGDGRISESQEIDSMHKIISKLINKTDTNADFLPLKLIRKEKIIKNEEITNAYNIIAEKTNLGTQHEWLARLATEYPRLEIGTEKNSERTSYIIRALNKYVTLEYCKEEEAFKVNRGKSSSEGNLVFGNFLFPIIDKNGLKMKENIILWGYEDVMKSVWVCHTPIFGEACGLCHPCELKIETDMGFILGNNALKRYNRKHNFLLNKLDKFQRMLSIKLSMIKRL